MNHLKIFIIAEILCREFEEGTSTPSSTSTAATLPMPGFSYLVPSSWWWWWRCFFRGSQRCLHRRWNERTKKARRKDSPSLGRGKRWIHFMSWSNCLCFCWSNASGGIMSEKTFTFTFSSKLSLFWPTNQSFSAAMERWGWHREEFAKSVKRNFPPRSCRPNQLVLKSVSIGWKYYLHLIWTVEKEFLRK